MTNSTNETQAELPYAVNHWGSHPDEGKDDCYTGEDFATPEEALAKFNEDASDDSVAYIELDGPGVHDLRKNPRHRPPRGRDEDEWRREAQMLHAMEFGCEGWNQYEGM